MNNRYQRSPLLARIFLEIECERSDQDSKWGGYSHDDKHGSHDWIAYIVKHTGKSIQSPWNENIFRKQMIRVAALAVAAVEWLDRNKLKENNK